MGNCLTPGVGNYVTFDTDGDGQSLQTDFVTPAEQVFVLEKYLQEFMFSNWDCLELGQEWALYAPDGDAETGVEFPTDIGRIDLLAKHRTEARWLVVELKRNQTSDDTVGQILRYRAGWGRSSRGEGTESRGSSSLARRTRSCGTP